MDQFSHCQGVKYAKKIVSYYLIIPPFFVNYLMSLVLQILRFLSGCIFSQSGQIPRFPILPTLGIPVLCLFFSSSIALFGNTANHTVFLTESDVVMGTGNNAYGQLSVPVVTQSSVPIQSKFGIRQIASGDHHSFLMWDGTVWAVGSNSDGSNWVMVPRFNATIRFRWWTGLVIHCPEW